MRSDWLKSVCIYLLGRTFRQLSKFKLGSWKIYRCIVSSESKIVILLFLLGSCCSTTYTPCGLRVVKQIKNIVHKVVFVRIFLVVQSCFQCLLENCDDVSAIGSRDEFKRALDFFKELVATVNGLLLQVDFVCDADAGNVGALVPHLGVPVAQIGVGHFARHIKHHYANVRSEVVRRMQLIE